MANDPRSTRPVPDVGKIAILRANGLGDLMFALPAAETLRAAYPDAEIVWLGRPLHAAVLAHRPGPVDRTIVVPPCHGVRDEPGEDPRQLDAFFERMAEERFDLALQLHGGGRYSNPFVRRLDARISVGMKTPDAEPLDRFIPYIYFQPEVMRYLEVVSLVGAAARTLEPALAVTDHDRLEAAAVWSPAADTPLVVMHPGATDGRRRWPAARFAMAAEALIRAGAEVAVIGLKEEDSIVEEVLSGMRVPAINLCGRLSLAALIGLLKRGDLFIGNDSGPLHVAAAVGARTVGIFWCGNLINGGPFTRGRHRPALSWCLVCPVCGTNCITGHCDHHESFVADVRVDTILESAYDLLLADRESHRTPMRSTAEREAPHSPSYGGQR